MGWVYYASPEVASLSRYPTIVTVCVVLTVLMILTVSARIAVRARQRRTGADDYIVFVGMVGLVSAEEVDFSANSRIYRSSASSTISFASFVRFGCINIC